MSSVNPTTPQSEGSAEEIKKNLTELKGNVGKFWKQLIDLREGLDKEGTVVFIQNNKRMRGANAWLLMCSIMIASLGLDKESPAIIIGAMLISPLMSPILGVGLSVAINDRRTMMISLRHFGIAIVIALLTSIIYFLITPLGEFNSEMAARTRPDFLDASVALFGGLAGIISITRKEMSNAIPGVAIATALMPPLCVAGYGIANGQWSIFQEAFYLFFLNSVIIAIATFTIVKILDFDTVAYQEGKERRRTNLLMAAVAVLIIVPSILIGIRVYAENEYMASAKRFVESNFSEQENLIDYDVMAADSVLIIRLFGSVLSDSTLNRLQRELSSQPRHTNTLLNVVQEQQLDSEKLALLQSQYHNVKAAISELDETKNEVDSKQEEIDALKSQISSYVPDSVLISEIYKECLIVVDDLESISIGQVSTQDGQGGYRQTPAVIARWDKNLRYTAKLASEKKLEAYLKERMDWEDVLISAY